jgi:hypothetical protein
MERHSLVSSYFARLCRSPGRCFWELTSQEHPFKAQFCEGLRAKVQKGHLPLPKEYSHQ